MIFSFGFDTYSFNMIRYIKYPGKRPFRSFLGAAGATAPIEMGWVGAMHPKNWLNSNSHKLLGVLLI